MRRDQIKCEEIINCKESIKHRNRPEITESYGRKAHQRKWKTEEVAGPCFVYNKIGPYGDKCWFQISKWPKIQVEGEAMGMVDSPAKEREYSTEVLEADVVPFAVLRWILRWNTLVQQSYQRRCCRLKTHQTSGEEVGVEARALLRVSGGSLKRSGHVHGETVGP